MSAPPEKLPTSASYPFTKTFQSPAVWKATAPGRVNLIGEHIDYNDGFVLPAAIDRGVTALAAPNGTRTMRVRTGHADGEALFDLETPPSPEEERALWMRYPLGVLAGFLERGAEIPGLDIWLESTVPLGAGLSSSAALEVAVASLLEIAADHPLSPKEKALLCQKAEHVYAKVPCGIMDQFASVMGKRDHLLLIDCRSQEVTPVAMNDDSVCLLVANTNVQHALASSEYRKRKEDCDHARDQLGADSWRSVREDDLAPLSGQHLKRARHVVSEIQRTQEAVTAIAEKHWETLGKLMFASHASLATDYEVSCPELDTLVALARDLGPDGGVYGARMMGGGFGGSTISLVRTTEAQSILEYYQAHYFDQTGIPLEAFITRPAEGTQAQRLATPF